jgi:hypothetical protein
VSKRERVNIFLKQESFLLTREKIQIVTRNKERMIMKTFFLRTLVKVLDHFIDLPSFLAIFNSNELFIVFITKAIKAKINVLSSY